MTHKERIIKYMEMKRDLTIPRYFLEDDAQLIREWPEGLAAEVWLEIKAYIPIRSPFDGSMCPFCIYQHLTHEGETVCGDCEYALNHGCVCDDRESDFQDARRIICRKPEPDYSAIYKFIEEN